MAALKHGPDHGLISRKNQHDLFCRYELKYRIRETKARAIAQFVQSYISPDRYARKSARHDYPISSLYFDSDQLHLAKETIDQKKNRFKLRVRCYDDAPDTPCFVEIKRRINNVILKNRTRIAKADLADAMRGKMPPKQLYEKELQTLKQFHFYLQSLCAKPVVSIRYMRQAYEGDSTNRVRVTFFDRELAFKPAGETPVVAVNGKGWHPVLMDFVILEIKFSNRYPAWLTDMIKIFDLKQTAMSKYVSSMKQSSSTGLYSAAFLNGQYHDG